MSTTNTNFTCPFKGCKLLCPTTNTLREHLTTNHPESLHKIPDTWWTENRLYPCKHCSSTNIFRTQGFLNRHIRKTHLTKKEGIDNLTLLNKHIPTPPLTTSLWKENLPWLHNLKIKPPPFRQNIWHKTNTNTKNKIKHLYHLLIKSIVDSNNEIDERPKIPHLHDRDPLWKLGMIFESLILHPIPNNSKDGTAEHINKRLHLFQKGDITTLYQLSREVISLSPQQKKDKADKISLQKNQKHAQIAANLDNYKSALDRLSNSTPIALNNTQNVEILKKLYPTKHKIKNHKLEYLPNNTTTQEQSITFEDFIKNMTRIPKGKAAGPMADISDIIRALVTHKDHFNNTNPYAKTIYDFFNLILNAKIPKKYKEIFHLQLCFWTPQRPQRFKKTKTSSSWRRLAQSFYLNHSTTKQHLIHKILDALQLCNWNKRRNKFHIPHPQM